MTELLAYAALQRCPSAAPPCLACLSLPAACRPLSVRSFDKPVAELLPAWECVGDGAAARQYAFDGRGVVLVDPQAFREAQAAASARASALSRLSPEALGRAFVRLRRRCTAAPPAPDPQP